MSKRQSPRVAGLEPVEGMSKSEGKRKAKAPKESPVEPEPKAEAVATPLAEMLVSRKKRSLCSALSNGRDWHLCPSGVDARALHTCLFLTDDGCFCRAVGRRTALRRCQCRLRNG